MSGYQEISTRYVKATRGPFRCMWCGGREPAGAPSVHRIYRWDGEFQRERMHPECFAALTNYPEPDDLRDGFSEGDFARGRCDDRRDLPPEFAPDGGRLVQAATETR